MANLAIAGPNQQVVDAATYIGQLGGNAVDAAIAGILVACVNEPGILCLAGGAFVAVGGPGQPVTVLDGNTAVPAAVPETTTETAGAWWVDVDYGKGTRFMAGPATAAIPGTLKALQQAHRQHGKVPWYVLFDPAVQAAKKGFPLTSASSEYLRSTHEALYGYDPESQRMIEACAGENNFEPGNWVTFPELGYTLAHLADKGADDFYTGDIAAAIVADQRERGGLITAQDLAEYTCITREPTRVHLGDWEFHTNPPPAIGGAVLAALLLTATDTAPPGVTELGDATGAWVQAQKAVLRARAERLDISEDLKADAAAFLDEVANNPGEFVHSSSSTAHISVVDTNGLTCSLTASCGYGSGHTVPGTGLMFNNALGEPELNGRGIFERAAGERIATNMAPTIGYRADGAVLAIGSPGASRITTALAQTIWNIAGGDTLQVAINKPRLHVSLESGEPVVFSEPGLDPAGEEQQERFDDKSMFFGGVAAAVRQPDGTMLAAADPRRSGVSRTPTDQER